MKMELSAKTVKSFVKAIENMNEMTLIVFDDKGVKTRLVNPSHTCMLDVRIPIISAESFEFKESRTSFSFPASVFIKTYALNIGISLLVLKLKNSAKINNFRKTYRPAWKRSIAKVLP